MKNFTLSLTCFLGFEKICLKNVLMSIEITLKTLKKCMLYELLIEFIHCSLKKKFVQYLK